MTPLFHKPVPVPLADQLEGAVADFPGPDNELLRAAVVEGLLLGLLTRSSDGVYYAGGLAVHAFPSSIVN